MCLPMNWREHVWLTDSTTSAVNSSSMCLPVQSILLPSIQRHMCLIYSIPANQLYLLLEIAFGGWASWRPSKAKFKIREIHIYNLFIFGKKYRYRWRRNAKVCKFLGRNTLKWGMCKKKLELFNTWYYSSLPNHEFVFYRGRISMYFTLKFYTYTHILHLCKFSQIFFEFLSFSNIWPP